MRIVVSSPEHVASGATGDTLVVDERRRLPGRGAWLHPSPDCLDLAVRRRAFARALRLQGSPDLSGVAARIAAVVAGGPEAVPASRPWPSEHRKRENADEQPMSTTP